MATPSDPNPGDRITNYSQTQRIVLLIDLNPLLHLPNPSPYFTPLLSSIQTLLSFPPLASSLFAFRPFFSSLSPLLSSSKLPTSLSLSFHLPNPTFLSLSQTLNSLPAFHRDTSSPNSSAPRASCLAASLRQLVHDYAWDPVVCDPVTGMFSNCDSVAVRSNLVVLFSPVCTYLNCLSEFLNVGMGDESLDNLNAFRERFLSLFENVNNAFVSRDIQCSWVDVRYELDKAGDDEDRARFGFCESGIRSLGWGFCSTDSVVLGSALVPFGLIYPEIGISSKFFGCSDDHKKVNTQLNLEILDVSGKPLECKFCDLQLVDLKMFPRNTADDVFFSPEIINSQTKGYELKKMFWGNFGNSVTKFQVKTLQRDNEFLKFKEYLSDPLLVYEVSEKPGKYGKASSGNLFSDKVLDRLAVELGEIVQRKSAPIWQILLSFLYRDGQCALVSLSNDSGVSYTGILKPLTVSSALLFIVDEGFYTQKAVHDIGGGNVNQLSPKMNNEICETNADLNQTGPPPSNKHSAGRDGRKWNKKKNSHLLQDLTWSTFCKAAFEHSELGLEEVYFARECNNLKKLKFLKCWMKQIKKSSICSPIVEKESQADQDNQKEMDNRLDNLHQESEQPISSSASGGENSLTVASGIQDEAALEFRSETSEAFFSSLSNKIQQGLEYEAVDLGALAYRLVTSSIYWLNQKRDAEPLSESQTPLVKSGHTDDLVAAEVLKLLLRDPKDINARHKSSGLSFKASDTGSEGFTSGKIFREYELQIFFRMEILQSEVGQSIAESAKQKFVKHICSFLEKIRCRLDGGFFGDWSLDDYVDKIIKSRYCETLGDVVHRVYTKMDLLLFADEEELPNSFLNSEDSNQSYREQPERGEVDENNSIKELVSAEDQSLHLQKNDNRRPSAQETKQKEHGRKLIEAQERREKARRFSSFTRGVPDLQRVWAPKQPKALKPKSNPHRKLFKRKDHRDSCDDRVCETPLTGSKRSCSQRSCDDSEDYQEYSSQLCGSVSKALFQDDQ